LCQIIRPGEPLDVTEIEELIELLADRPLFEPKTKTNGRGHAENNPRPVSDSGPIIVDKRLAGMRFKGPAESAIHMTQLQCSAAMLRAGVPADDVIAEVLGATKHATAGDERCKDWDWNQERLAIEHMTYSHINKNPELATALPDVLYEQWQTRLRDEPQITRNASGWYVRATPHRNNKDGEHSHDNSKADTGQADANQAGPAKSAGSKRRRSYLPPSLSEVTLEWWVPIDETALPPREWIYGKHYQRGVISGTIAPGGSGKTSLCMVEAIAMATCRNLLGEQPVERVRVWYHNAEDTQDEVNRRVVAICKHFKIPQQELVGWFIATSCEKFDLRVARGINELRVEDRTVDAIADKIHTLEIDVAIVDPLVNVHEVTEDHNTKMAAVAGLFRSIAQGENCAIEFTQHTRKMPAGVNGDYVGADARGASAWRDALRSQRVINIMAKDEAARNAIPEHERSLYFHVDIGKANNARPREPEWRRIHSIDLANGDNIGVVEPWNAPGTDPENPEVAARQKIADNLFLALLDQFTLQNRIVSDKPRGAYYAPRLFAEEDEAKAAHISLLDLKAAMTRLLKERRIKIEDATTRSDRELRKIVRT